MNHHLIDLAAANRWLEQQSLEARIDYAVATLPGSHIVSSSFGAQSAVALHLVVSRAPQVPVVLIDTGYLFAETYQFIDTLQQRLGFNLQIVRPELTPAWMEARHGKLWEQGVAGIDRYNQLHKVTPFQQALKALRAQTWIAGLRRDQSTTRATLPMLGISNGVYKLLPLLDCTNRDLHEYLTRHQLPYHPLWQQGYVSIGDWHTTRPLSDALENPEQTRFFGLKRECGLHV